MNGDIIQALKQIERERNIPLKVLQEAVESALTSSYRKNFSSGDNVWVSIDWSGGGDVKVLATYTIVNRRKDPNTEISLAQVKKLFKGGEIKAVYPPLPPQEEEAEEQEEAPAPDEQQVVFEMPGQIPLEDLALIPRMDPILDPTLEMLEPGYRVEMVIEKNPKNFGRIAAQTTKQVIIQKIREAERDIVFGEYMNRVGSVMSVTVQRFEHRNWVCDLGKAEGVIPPQEQAPGEHFRRGERIKCYVVSVDRTSRGPQVILSRTHPGLIRAVFKMEVPEIAQGLIEIQNVAREPGSRSKVSVRAKEPNVDPLGACVGPRGSRVQMVVDEMRGEKIDIINYTDDPFTFVSNALSPARVLTVTLNPDDRSALVIVPDDQFSLAIGKEGQNARLAAKLTNWKIDIKSEAQAREIESQRKEEEDVRRREEAGQKVEAEERKKHEAERKRTEEEEEKRRRTEEENRKKEEERNRLKEEEKRKRLEEEERKRRLEDEKRRKEEEELKRLSKYVPKFNVDENLEVLSSAPSIGHEKRKVIEEALKHIPDDVPVEQYVALAYGNDDIYSSEFYGKSPSAPGEEGKKKKKKKKKKHRGKFEFDIEY